MASENSFVPPSASDGGSGSTTSQRGTERARARDARRFAQGSMLVARPSTRLMAILGGADPQIIDRAPSEAGRFVTMFLVLLGTALVAGISMSFALVTAMKVWWLPAILIAVVWMALIFNLDRFLTASIKSTRNVAVLVFGALPRLLMAAVIGVVIAEPFVLQLFNDDITREMNAINQVEEATQLEALETGILASTRDQTRQRYLDLAEQERTGVIAGTGTTERYSVSEARARVTRLTEDLTQAATDQADAITRLNCERNGGSIGGVKCTPGEGDNFRAAERQVNETAARWTSLSQQLKAAEAALSAAEGASSSANESLEASNREQASTEVEDAKDAADEALSAYSDERRRIQSDVANSTGLLARMNALEKLTYGDSERGTEGSPIIGFGHFALASLFFMFEILPVVSKSFMAYGDKTPYEQVEALDRAAMVEREKMERNDARWESQQRSNNRRKQVQHMLNLEASQAQKANEHVAKEMEKILDSALASWSARLPHTLQQTGAQPGQAPPQRPGTP